MARFLIELPHNDDIDSCVKAVSLLLSTGSHFLTNADWGCQDGEHKAWVTVDVENKEQARAILPPICRLSAKIISLNKFSIDDFDKMFYRHQNSQPSRDS